MAAVPVTIVGIDQNGNQTTIVGMMSYTGLGVGGGPMPGGPGKPVDPGYGYPEKPVDPGYGIPEGRPPGIWGPNDPRPQPPIYLPPYEPGGPPVGIWPSPGHPAHPIVLPKPPEPPAGGGTKPPPPDGGWGYHPEYGWGYFPGPGEAEPKA